jgi:hypothetical protein
LSLWITVCPASAGTRRRFSRGRGPQKPLGLWLGEDGIPLRRSTWQTAFGRVGAPPPGAPNE